MKKSKILPRISYILSIIGLQTLTTNTHSFTLNGYHLGMSNAEVKKITPLECKTPYDNNTDTITCKSTDIKEGDSIYEIYLHFNKKGKLIKIVLALENTYTESQYQSLKQELKIADCQKNMSKNISKIGMICYKNPNLKLSLVFENLQVFSPGSTIRRNSNSGTYTSWLAKLEYTNEINSVLNEQQKILRENQKSQKTKELANHFSSK